MFGSYNVVYEQTGTHCDCCHTLLCNCNLSRKRNSLSFPFYFSHSLPSFSPFTVTWGEFISPPRNSVSPLFPQFPRIFLAFPPKFSRIQPISQWFPLIPQFPMQFSIQLHKCIILSLSIRPILCILHVFLKMKIRHYARQRIIDLGNSGEI